MLPAVKKIGALLCLFLTGWEVHALDRAPQLLRICLDRLNQTATLYWVPSSDNCASFNKLIVYGREDVSLIFSPMAEVVNPAQTSITIPLGNLKRWQFFLVARYACNGIDTLESDTLFVDDEEPPEMGLDSVSYDPLSGLLMAGWSPSVAADLKGYYLYHVTGTNSRIADTVARVYRIRGMNPALIGNRIAIAAYDSCNQASIISADHEAVTVRKTDSSYCNRTLSLRFTPYKGWAVDRYQLFVQQAGQPNWLPVAMLPGNAANLLFTVSLPQRQQVYRLFVRAYRQGSTTTSRSHEVSYYLDSQPEPSFRYIKRVSHLSNTELEIRGLTEAGLNSVQELIIERSADGSTWNTWTRIPYPDANGNWKRTLNVKEGESFFFRFRSSDQCSQVSQSSNASRNILLSSSAAFPYQLQWLDYIGWSNPVEEYQLLAGARNLPVSTWNVSETHANKPDFINIENAADKSLCYCIRAIENGTNLFGTKDTAYSNILCPFSGFDIYIPNAFRPGSLHNPIFKPTGLSLDSRLSKLSIYNRWGEKIYASFLLDGWDGRDAKGQPAPSGVYAFVLEAVDASGVLTHHRGMIHLLE